MNRTFVILGIIVVVLIFILYSYTVTKYLIQTAYLNTTNPALTISTNNNPYSQSFTINGWFYLNDNNGIQPNTPYYIFSRKSYAGIYIINTNNQLSMMLNVASLATNAIPSTTASTTPSTNPTQNTVIMDTVPVNDWIYITMSVYNSIIDVYINGKLAQSIHNNTKNPNNALSNSVGVGTDTNLVPSGSINAVISNLIYYPVYYSPSDASNSYINSKQMTIRDVLTKYTVGISLTNNGVLEQRQTIL